MFYTIMWRGMSASSIVGITTEIEKICRKGKLGYGGLL